MKTYSQKPTEVKREWYIVDAKGATLGRLASMVATRISGKHKPSYTPHTDGGDHVIIINAAKIKVTGNKLTQKRYYRHSGYPGALKSKTLEQELASHPERVIKHAVSGMLPDNKLKNDRMLRLKVYKGAEQPHEAQKPKTLDLASQTASTKAEKE